MRAYNGNGMGYGLRKNGKEKNSADKMVHVNPYNQSKCKWMNFWIFLDVFFCLALFVKQTETIIKSWDRGGFDTHFVNFAKGNLVSKVTKCIQNIYMQAIVQNGSSLTSELCIIYKSKIGFD